MFSVFVSLFMELLYSLSMTNPLQLLCCMHVNQPFWCCIAVCLRVIISYLCICELLFQICVSVR